MEHLISVIIPVYKVEDFLPRCVDSVLGQTYKKLEVILVDDGSPDNSGAICDQYAQRDHRVKVIHQKNAGVSAARNAALAIASGDYLTFVDSDDYLSEDALEVMLRRMLEDGSDHAVGRHVCVYEDGKTADVSCAWMRDGVYESEKTLEWMATPQYLPMVTCTKLYKKKLFEGVAFPPYVSGEDIRIFPAIMEKSQKISVVDHTVYYYYQHSASVTHVYNAKTSRDSLENDLFLTRYLWDKGVVPSAVKWYGQCMNRTYRMQDRKEIRSLLAKYFDTRTRLKLLLRQKPKTWIVWLAIYIPAIKKAVVLIKGKQ